MIFDTISNPILFSFFFLNLQNSFDNWTVKFSIFIYVTVFSTFRVGEYFFDNWFIYLFIIFLICELDSEDPRKRPKNVVDVGCGIGGSSRYLAKKFGAKCQGITLSPVQAQRANALAAARGLADKVGPIFLVS